MSSLQDNDLPRLTHLLHRHRGNSPKEVAARETILGRIASVLSNTTARGVLEDSHAQSYGQAAQMSLFERLENVPFPGPQHPQFSFIDLFAGIGGIRIPFDELGGDCVFSSEWDEKACETYLANFGVVPYEINVW